MPSRDKHPVVYDPRTGKLFSDPRLGGLDEINISMGGGGAVDSIAGQTGVVTLADINLDNVDNTSDADKPVSTAQQAALNGKATTTALTNGLASKADAAAISNIDNTSDADKPVSTAQQTALDAKADILEWTLTANGSSAYIFAGAGFAGTENNPTIYLMRGQTYKFTNNMNAHPFQIQSTTGTSGTPYSNGVTNNAVSNGTLTWEVRMDAPATLYYQCTAHAAMNGTINVLS
ncbi:MAG: hypothetical protein CL981_00430 [Euryarchaeota archaeon]|nr:hypothetical protein [Euryarchaeota archaeon]